MGSAQAFFDAQHWLRSLMKDCGLCRTEDLSTQLLTKKTKDSLSLLVHGAANIISKMIDHNDVQVRKKVDMGKELIKCQSSVIDLQKKLLDAKEVQLKSITSAVTEKVGEVKNDVQAELRSYSEVLQSRKESDLSLTLCSAEMKTAVKTALADRADEEGRQNNLMIFGLKEEAEENIADKVNELFCEINEKPHFDAKRLGRNKSGEHVRPVRVVLQGSQAIRQILVKAVKLRETEVFKSVFISPDRTPEQRAAQRELVTEVKRRRVAEPHKRHFIRGGTVASVDGE